MFSLLFLLSLSLGYAQNFTQIIRDIACSLPRNDRAERASFLGGNVRLVFHDAAGGEGRANGCYDANEPANNGLAEYSAPLELVFQKYKRPGLSRADIWVLAGQVAVYLAGGPKIKYRTGRTDCQANNPPSDVGMLPTTTMTFQQVLGIMQDRMGFTPQEITALMGAHSLGGAETENSGMEGQQVANNARFANTYYKDTRKFKWTRTTEKFGADKPVWTNNQDLLRFDTDVQLVVDTTNCENIGPHGKVGTCAPNPLTSGHFQQYATDQNLWFKDFSKAYRKLANLGYDNLKVIPLEWESRPVLNALDDSTCPPIVTPPPPNKAKGKKPKQANKGK